MSIVDLSYAKEQRARAQDPDSIRSLSMSIRGWTVGWAMFEGEQAREVGHFTIRDTVKGGTPVPCYQRVMGAMSEAAKLAMRFQAQIIVSHTKAQGPLWTLAPILALTLGVIYGDMPDWKEHIGKNIKELRGWATLLLGKEPEDETEVLALGLGAAAANARLKAAVRTEPVTMEAVGSSQPD